MKATKWPVVESPGSAGGPLDSTLTMVVLLYANAFEFMKTGYAAAMSVVLFLMISLVTVFNVRLQRYDVAF